MRPPLCLLFHCFACPVSALSVVLAANAVTWLFECRRELRLLKANSRIIADTAPIFRLVPGPPPRFKRKQFHPEGKEPHTRIKLQPKAFHLCDLLT